MRINITGLLEKQYGISNITKEEDFDALIARLEKEAADEEALNTQQ